jgi:hypothetical protein
LLACCGTDEAKANPKDRVFLAQSAFVELGAPFATVEDMMTDRCPQCHRIGLIRSEHVIKGEESATFFFCGGCSFSWEEPDVASAITASAERERPNRTLDAR